MDELRDRVAEVLDRAEALSAALDVGAAWLDPDVVEQGRNAVEGAVARFELGARHTVVALVGATGGGKSSLFNALAVMEIAQVGARRPLTEVPMACVWGNGGSQDLLDWLDVPPTHRMIRESVLDADYQAPLNGLVLLDLPDHDSTEVIHRVEVDRLVTKVDLLIWVVDPQKYADDALHSGYLQRMAGHAGVMVVVLNQIDRLTRDEADACLQDLRRLLDADGLESVRTLAISATRGDGVENLRRVLAGVVRDRSAIAERVGADLQASTDAVFAGLAVAEPGDAEPPGADRLVEELSAAAGVPTVAAALAAEYRRRGRKRAGWPLLRWLRWLTPDPRARVSRVVAEQDLQAITTSRVLASAPSQRPRVALAVEAATAASAATLPPRWADAVRESISRADGDLAGALDARVSAVDLKLSPPAWWWLVATLQFLTSLLALGGAVWLLLIGLLRVGTQLGTGRVIRAQTLDPARPIGLPLPLVMIVVGLGLGSVLAGLTAWALRVGAGRRGLAAQLQLRLAVEAVAYQRVIVPIRVVLARHRATRVALTDGPAALPGLGYRPDPDGTGFVPDADLASQQRTLADLAV